MPLLPTQLVTLEFRNACTSAAVIDPESKKFASEMMLPSWKSTAFAADADGTFDGEIASASPSTTPNATIIVSSGRKRVWEAVAFTAA